MDKQGMPRGRTWRWKSHMASWGKRPEGGRMKRNKTPRSQPEAQAAENAQSD
ncbi:hypothetical protein DPMN_138098 [Dreissena polymorpha]|uniref:Uncharacterized protein n=1 Tax=Dreissena polymorpha TaxID=45954 RepID=A0A9D4JJG8_DREPO|nr:hypothetical protein DPMN_138098 [Dreissena polymorpha]